MKKKSIEISVGIFVLIGLACIAYLTICLGKLEVLGGEFYRVKAEFANVAGLKTRAPVQMAGVHIGRVEQIDLEPEFQTAVVTMKIDSHVDLYKEVTASIKTHGLIGDKYVELESGGSDEKLEPGGVITKTQSAIAIEEIISKFAFGDVEG